MKNACLERGVILQYLPPYSPDFNPIEQSFHWLKQWVRRNQDKAPAIGEEAYEERFELFLREACEEFTHKAPHLKFWAHAHWKVDYGVANDDEDEPNWIGMH